MQLSSGHGFRNAHGCAKHNDHFEKSARNRSIAIRTDDFVVAPITRVSSVELFFLAASFSTSLPIVGLCILEEQLAKVR